MRNGIFPIFTKGRVLKKESIEYLRDFPNDLASLAYGEYSDGIIFGFSVRYENGWVVISKGALKYKGNIIILSENNIVITEYEQLLFIKLIIGECCETEDYKYCLTEIKLDNKQPQGNNEIELGRFCLNHGAVLRCDYDSFGDLRTAENTLDITNVLYAGPGSATPHPLILKEFAKAILTVSSDTVDINFGLMCVNSRIVNKDCIQWYIAKKRNIDYGDYTLPELYRKLLEIISQRAPVERALRPQSKGPRIS